MKPRAWWKRLLRWLLAAVLAFIATSVLVVFVFRFAPVPTSAFMLERRLDAALGGEHGLRIVHEWTPIEAMSAQLPIAMVAAEDQKFPHHHGFDVEAIQAAMADAEDGERLRGASTISQQVAKNLFLWQGSHRVTRWARKGLEAWYTVLIEALWPKSRILEVYANIAEFGDGVYGGQAAARRYWGKDAARLTPAESARLAAVLPSPRRYSAAKPGPYVQRRAKRIQRQVVQIGGTAYLEALR